MKKLLYVLILLCLFVLPSHAGQQSALSVLSRINAGGGACTTATDGLLDGLIDTNSSNLQNTWTATQVTLTAATVTEFLVYACDNHGTPGTGNLRVSLFTNDAAPTPDEPDTEVGSSNANIAMSAFSACESYTSQPATLGTPLEGQTGTFWIVTKEENSAAAKISYDTTSRVGDIRCASADGLTWTCTADTAINSEVYGCE